MEAFNIFIGLKDSAMSKALDRDFVFKTTCEKLNSIGIIGFNVSDIQGFWKGEQEDSLKFSFINTFEIKENDLKRAICSLKDSLKQESILLEKSQVEFDFI
jgi:hypothetical protein